ncbi:MAG: hypothetical protein KY476_25110 [Planctomycetes bacterium]|nr:hypothetical protein [Planctomycetota bacterium]
MRWLFLATMCCLCVASALAADEEVFSGPQPGEKLPPLTVRGVFGDEAGKEWDVIAEAGAKPVLVVFVHERTRPAFAVVRGLMQYAKSRKREELAFAVVWLSAAVTETEKWLKAVDKHLPDEVTSAVSLDGAEGPGAWGLNRKVTLTVIVGKDGKARANHALVQPGAQADLPKILKDVTAVAGGKVPSLAELGVGNYAPRRP